MMIETTPSALTLAHDCQLAHHLQYNRKLRAKTERRSVPLASGSAVHNTVEQWLYGQEGGIPTLAELAAIARVHLKTEFEVNAGKDKVKRDKLVNRYLPGVIRALSRVPEWIWTAEWESEANVAATFEFPEADLTVAMHGRPDLYRSWVDENNINVTEIVDIKTTKSDPMEYVLWSPQLRFYAAMLNAYHPKQFIQYRYVTVPTGVKDVPGEAIPFYYTHAVAKKTLHDIKTYALETLGTEPRYSRRCSWCQFAPRCTAEVTGANVAGIEEEFYHVRT